jgi:hypothetical protein
MEEGYTQLRTVLIDQLHDLASATPRCAHKRQHPEQVMPEAAINCAVIENGLGHLGP